MAMTCRADCRAGSCSRKVLSNWGSRARIWSQSPDHSMQVEKQRYIWADPQCNNWQIKDHVVLRSTATLLCYCGSTIRAGGSWGAQLYLLVLALLKFDPFRWWSYRAVLPTAKNRVPYSPSSRWCVRGRAWRTTCPTFYSLWGHWYARARYV